MPSVVANHYVLLETPARTGGLSSVKRGIDSRDGSAVAVKFIKGRTDELAKKVFQREIAALRALEHPNIVRCRDSGIDVDGTYFIVLDWVDRNLKDVLENGPWKSWDELWDDFARPLMSGLSYAHLKQIEHRDIKPHNVLMGESGAPLLADFGIAKIRDVDQHNSDLTVANFRSGPYAPPEMDSPIRYVRDVYSVGVLLLQCLSVEKIRDFPDIAVALDSVNAPPEIRKILEACVSTDPAERPRNASELLIELSNVAKRRSALQASGRRPIWLRLTNAAVTALASEDGVADRPRAAARLLSDLAGEVYASFKYLHDEDRHDRKTLMLAGKENRYTAKLDEDGSGGVIIAVTQLEFESLEALRRRSCQVPDGYTWSVQEPANREQAKRGLAELVGIIDDHIEAYKVGKQNLLTPREGDELFDLWLRILDAREDLARGELKPLKYKSWRASGRQAIFQLDEPTELDLIGTEWRIQDIPSGRRYGWGEVIDQDAENMTLVGLRLNNVPPKASLVPHAGPSEVALARQRDAVVAVKSGTAVRPDLRRILLDPTMNSEPVKFGVESWGLDLDQSKREAVEYALGAQDILLVQGPPGTGKTSFIAETVMQTIRSNPRARILIASQTHVAVDNALERIHRSGLTGLVRLAGADESRVDPTVRHLLLDAQTRKWAQGVRAKAEANIAKAAQAAGIEPGHLKAAVILQQIGSVADQIDAMDARLSDDESGDSTPSDLSTALEVDDVESGSQVKIDNLVEFRGELVAQAQAVLGGDLTISADISSADAYSAVDLLVGQGAAGQQLLSRLKIQAEWLQRVAADDTLANVYLATANVVAGTCTGFLRNRAVRSLNFDLCIVDEASKATLTEALVPMSRARKWILVGDTNQLPPTDEDLLRASEILIERELTKEDILQTLFQRLADLLAEHSQRMLRTQYRMIQPIGDLISTCFYGGQLQSPKKDGLDGYDKVFGRPVMWLDTGPLGDRRRESEPGGQATSFANRAEAQLAIGQLKTLDGAIDYGLIKLDDDRNSLDVLLISPYKSQVDELRRKVAPVPFKHIKVSVMSVDSVQGREADITIFSVTRSNSEARLGFLGADYWRRINVALSRARFGLIIIGDRSFIQGTTGALRQALEYIIRHPGDCEMRLASRD